MLFHEHQNRSAPAGTEVPLGARREAVHKVLSSATLEKSARLRDLLSYLAERSIENAEVAIPEQEIGVAVFDRKDYGANQDNLVRVQATQLRKKLQQYFATEGAADEVVVEIPRGNYALRFQFRDALAASAPARTRLRRPYIAALAATAGLALVAAGWFARGLALNRPDPRPAVRKLWSQFFANGLETHVVLADANLATFNDFMKRSIVLRQYGRTALMQEWARERFQDPEWRRLVLRMSGKYFVTLADAAAARKIEAVALSPESRIRYRFARGFSVDHLMGDNAVLLGNKRANPWVELFDKQLRFRYFFDDENTTARFEDTQAGPGQRRVYPTLWDRASYCQVAVLPNFRQTGSVAIIAGGDQSAAEAGSEFLTSDRWISELARRLGVAGNQPFPHFEAILQTETVSETAPSFRLLFAWKNPGQYTQSPIP